MDQYGTYHAPLFHNIIMHLETIDSKVTSAVLGDKLGNLDAKMVQLKSKILAFHFYLSTNCNQLLGHLEAFDILVHLLFMALTVQHINFVWYIARKEEEYFEEQALSQFTCINGSMQ